MLMNVTIELMIATLTQNVRTLKDHLVVPVMMAGLVMERFARVRSNNILLNTGYYTDYPPLVRKSQRDWLITNCISERIRLLK